MVLCLSWCLHEHLSLQYNRRDARTAMAFIVSTWQFYSEVYMTCTCSDRRHYGLTVLEGHDDVMFGFCSGDHELRVKCPLYPPGEVVTSHGSIEPDKDNIREEPYSLPQGFCWDALDLGDPAVVTSYLNTCMTLLCICLGILC